MWKAKRARVATLGIILSGLTLLSSGCGGGSQGGGEDAATSEDGAVFIQVEDVTVPAGSDQVTFTVTLSLPAEQGVSVAYATGDLTAVAGTD